MIRFNLTRSGISSSGEGKENNIQLYGSDSTIRPLAMIGINQRACLATCNFLT